MCAGRLTTSTIIFTFIFNLDISTSPYPFFFSYKKHSKVITWKALTTYQWINQRRKDAFLNEIVIEFNLSNQLLADLSLSYFSRE